MQNEHLKQVQEIKQSLKNSIETMKSQLQTIKNIPLAKLEKDLIAKFKADPDMDAAKREEAIAQVPEKIREEYERRILAVESNLRVYMQRLENLESLPAVLARSKITPLKIVYGRQLTDKEAKSGKYMTFPGIHIFPPKKKKLEKPTPEATLDLTEPSNGSGAS